MPIVALDGGWTDLLSAEHDALDLLERLGGAVAEATVCTHVLRLASENRYALTIAAPRTIPAGSAGASVRTAHPDDDSPLGRLAGQHAQRSGGRAMHFPGQDLLRGRLGLDAVITLSAIEAFHHTGNPPKANAVLATRDFVRPTFADGRLVLVTQPGLDGDVMPFEVENPTRCCEFHV